ncbi:MAG: hypothetical protein VX438_14770, partial [Planctomycetota bacterium]|nr:hypothetical protein [Planctomycetota bacterium]
GLTSPPGSGNPFGQRGRGLSGQKGALKGSRGQNARGLPGSMKTPAGDAPVVFGGDPDRTPSPYARTPDDERMQLDSDPAGRVANGKSRFKGGGVEPFSESNRPAVAHGLPSSSRNELDGSSTKIKSKVNHPNIDPFAELGRTPSNSNAATNSNPAKTSASSTTANPPVGFNDKAPERKLTSDYKPPVILNKLDDTTRKADIINPASSTPPENSNQMTILLAIGVVAILILVMIALLVVVLIKAKPVKPSRSYF